MDIRKIKKLIELIDETGVDEIEVHEGEESVRIKRYSQPPAVAPAPVVQHIAPAAPTAPPAQAEVVLKSLPVEGGHQLTSPMVGTVYLSATPGANPFVEVGQHVEVGDTVCVIEAMKMFNQIEADKAGKITARLVDNASPVEFDQSLFIIE